MARAHPEVAYTYTTVGSASGSGAVDDAQRLRAPRCRSTSASISQDAFGQHAAPRARAGRRRDGVHVRGQRLRRRAESRCSSSCRGRTPTTLDAARRADRRLGARRRRARSTSACRPRPEARARRRSSIAALAGSLGVTVGAGRAVAAPRVRRRRRRRLGRSDRRDARRHVRLAPEARENAADLGAAAARRAPARRRRADDRAARPGRDDHAEASGRRRSTTSIASRVVTVEANIAGRVASANVIARRHDSASNGVQLPPGYAHHAGRRDRGSERGVRAACFIGARRRGAC